MGYVKNDDAVRRWPRIPVELRGELTGRASWNVSIQDLSLGGCLVQCDAALDRGSIVDVAVQLGSGQSVDVKGRIVHASLDGALLPRALRYLVGVEFLAVPVREEKVLRQFLESESRRRGLSTLG